MITIKFVHGAGTEVVTSVRVTRQVEAENSIRVLDTYIGVDQTNELWGADTLTVTLEPYT